MTWAGRQRWHVAATPRRAITWSRHTRGTITVSLCYWAGVHSSPQHRATEAPALYSYSLPLFLFPTFIPIPYLHSYFLLQ